jgi:Mg-chelatase subunit ChlD
VNWISIPAGLIVAAAVIPPLILLYFLKLRRRTQAIACTLLWQRSVEDLRANAPFQRLRRSLLLLLQLLALALLALAIMQPQIQAGRRAGGRTVILIDNSASMTAIDGDDQQSRLDEAKRRASNRIEELYGRGLFTQSAGETMVVAFSDRAEVYTPFTDSKPQLLSAIRRIRPTHGRSRIADALALARAFTTNVDPDSDRPLGEPATLELFSDGRIDDLADQVLRGETLLYYPIGKPTADNVAFTAISMERPYDRPTAVEVFAAMANFNTETVIASVQLSVNGVASAIEEVVIEGAETDPATGMLIPSRRNVIFTPFEQPSGAVIEVANLRADDLAADNAVRLVVPPPRRLAVALVGSDSFLLKTVLEGMGSIDRIDKLTGSQFDELAQTGGVDQYDVVVLDNYAPSAEHMVPGRYLAFGATPPLEGLNEFGRGKAQLVLDIEEKHPLFRFVNLDQLYISRYNLLQPADDVQVLAEGSDGPVIVALARGPMHVVYVTFDPLDSNWPFQRSFVTFVVNAVEYLGHAGEAISESSFSPGEALSARLPAAAENVELMLPGRETSVPVPAIDPTQFSWGPIQVSGVYGVSWEMPGEDDRAGRPLAVNAISESEGDIRPALEIFTQEDNVHIASGGGNQYMPLWPWAIGLCLAVIMLEWWVYHRKSYI